MRKSFLDVLFEEPQSKLADVADAVLRLSDFYIDNPTIATPWSEKYCQLAYRHYYLPLNFVRNAHIVERGNQVGFFNGLNTMVDWGAGPGTASLAIHELDLFQNFYMVDSAKATLAQFQDLWTNIPNFTVAKNFTTELGPGFLKAPQKSGLLACSYSLTEKNALPIGWKNFEALMILEPATSDDGRRLLNLRTQLIEEGFSIWAPCLHHQACPLLKESKKDWCHDRAHVQAPEWFQKLEQLLPMKNRTVTTSYLLARKQKPAHHAKVEQGLVRLIGDQLIEKGKTRQLACRSEKREFITWLHKNGQPDELFRGDFFQLPAATDSGSGYELISNEIRIKK